MSQAKESMKKLNVIFILHTYFILNNWLYIRREIPKLLNMTETSQGAIQKIRRQLSWGGGPGRSSGPPVGQS